jgi:biotin synthase
MSPNTTTSTRTRWFDLADRVLEGHAITEGDALDILGAPDTEIVDLMAAAYRVRHHHFGNRVKLNYLVNAKNGLCPEDCNYCSQSANSEAPLEKYRLMTQDQIIEKAEHAAQLHAGTCCIVISGRGPSDEEVEHVAGAVRVIKERHPDLKICACLGLLNDGQAQKLADAGADRYNHNVNTAESYYDEVCSTHTYRERLETVEAAKKAGISPCSGVIVGMGETRQQVVESALALKAIDADSIPVNFLLEIKGTALATDEQVASRKSNPNIDEITPRYCLKVLAMFRFVNPTKEIRASAGREEHLRSMQPMSLYAANALFLADYLTEPGQAPDMDRKMIEDLGFEWEAAGA